MSFIDTYFTGVNLLIYIIKVTEDANPIQRIRYLNLLITNKPYYLPLQLIKTTDN